MTWRTARCLDDLLHEVDAVAPHRKKGRDGTIGDTAHQARASRHNPNAAGVVTARDVTDDPAGGMPIHVYVRALIARPDLIPNDLDYVISNGQVASRERGPWTWRPYDGADPHDLHAHFGVGRGPDSAPIGPYDDPTNWHVAELLAHQEDDMTPDQAQLLADAARDIKSIRAETDKLYTGQTISAIAEAVVKILPAEHGGQGLTAAQVADELAKRLKD